MSTNITTNATNKTPNYGLPIFIGSDKPSWLTDWNGAMTEIDSLLKEIATNGSANSTQIEGLKTSLETANNAITALQEGLSTTTENTTKNTTDIGTLNSSMSGVQDDLIAQNTLVKTLSTTVATLSETVSRLEGTVADIKNVKKIVDLSGVSFSNYNYGTFYNIPALDLGEEFDVSKPIIVTLCAKNGERNLAKSFSIFTTILATDESNAKTLSLGSRIYSANESSLQLSEETVTVSLYCDENGKVYFRGNKHFSVTLDIAKNSGEGTTTFVVNGDTSSGAIGNYTDLSNSYLIFEQ